jgi:hypothetical protein
VITELTPTKDMRVSSTIITRMESKGNTEVKDEESGDI